MEMWQIAALIPAAPIAFALTVMVHEYGHWVGGILSGYRTVYICLFSFVFYRDASGKHRNARYPGMTGQCIMVPKDGREPEPDNLAAGGPLMSMAAGIVSAVAMWAAAAGQGLFPTVLLGMLATLNLTFGITNLIPRGTNDGANMREIRKSDANRKAYNRIMEVYAYNVWGVTFMEMPEELLAVPEGAEGSFAEELREYAGIREEAIRYMGLAEPDAAGAPVKGEPGTKDGSWELWEKCRKDSPENAGTYLEVCRRHIKRKELGLGEWRTAEELMTKLIELNGTKKEIA